MRESKPNVAKCFRLLLDGKFHEVVQHEQGHVHVGTPMHHVLKKGDAWIQDPRSVFLAIRRASCSVGGRFNALYECAVCDRLSIACAPTLH